MYLGGLAQSDRLLLVRRSWHCSTAAHHTHQIAYCWSWAAPLNRPGWWATQLLMNGQQSSLRPTFLLNLHCPIRPVLGCSRLKFCIKSPLSFLTLSSPSLLPTSQVLSKSVISHEAHSVKASMLYYIYIFLINSLQMSPTCCTIHYELETNRAREADKL